MPTTILFLAVYACLAVVSGSEPVPYGHPDFYPSPERPIGWRGDGTGAWPGATPVTNWNVDTGHNVVWRSPMPAPSFAQPIVVGEKVFTMADPDILVCVNVHDGAILWQTAVDRRSEDTVSGAGAVPRRGACGTLRRGRRTTGGILKRAWIAKRPAQGVRS